jgi:hypothetical protein
VNWRAGNTEAKSGHAGFSADVVCPTITLIEKTNGIIATKSTKSTKKIIENSSVPFVLFVAI